MFQTKCEHSKCTRFGPHDLCDQALVKSFEVIPGLDPYSVELQQDGLARLCFLILEVWVLVAQPVGEMLFVWVDERHKGFESHVHLLHGGLVPGAQQFVPRGSPVDVQLAAQVLIDNSVQII